MATPANRKQAEADFMKDMYYRVRGELPNGYRGLSRDRRNTQEGFSARGSKPVKRKRPKT